MIKLLEVQERDPQNRCHFCRTNRSVKYKGKVINPCLTAENRFIEILICNKCVTLHSNEIK